MLAYRALHAPVCASCRLHSAIAAKQLARCRKAIPISLPSKASFAKFSTSTRRLQQRSREELEKDFADPEAEDEGLQYAKELLARGTGKPSPEKAALTARETYGARLPEGVLDAEGYRVYERLYGKPLAVEEAAEEEEEGGVRLVGDEDGVVDRESEMMEGGGETALLREAEDGELEVVEVDAEAEEFDEVLDEDEELEMDEMEEEIVDDDMRLRADMKSALSSQNAPLGPEVPETAAEDQPSDPLERAHPLTTANRFGTIPTTLPLPATSLTEPITALLSHTNNKHLASSAHAKLGGIGLPYSPSTPARAKTLQARPIQIDAFQHSVSDIEGDVFLAAILPAVYASVVSVLTETRKRLGTTWAEQLVKKAEKGELRILDAGGAGAGVLAVREMLRAEWERMHEERSGLDSSLALAEAGGRLGGPGVSPPLGNATVVTGSDVLRHRASKLLENTTFIPRLPDYVHTAEQKAKGKFDLVIAPHTLWGGFRFDRERKTHVQNLWSLLDAEGGVLCLLEKGVSRGFEVVAGAREMLLRTRIRSSGSAGTEFDEETYAGAEIEWEGTNLEEPAEAEGTKTKGDEVETSWEKEKGTIIAPCTNHVACPMYRPKGFLKGRRDVCAFEQRYVRPPFLQRILGAKDKNYEDVSFSYLSVMRGRDLLEEKAVEQGEEAAEDAFVGYEAPSAAVDSLALPRQVLPPLKKKGHVLLDLCTPAGTLERWTIPRSFSKQAFRDARKSRWGDLWALGAKTRVHRGPKMSLKHGGRLSKAQRAEIRGLETEELKSMAMGKGERGGVGKGRRALVRDAYAVAAATNEGGELDLDTAHDRAEGQAKTVLDTDEYGHLVLKSAAAGAGGGAKGKSGRVGPPPGKVRGEGGRMRTGQKVGGLRDKRDKSGQGNGRRKMRSSSDD